MNALLIKLLLPYLPRYAEEDGDFFSVPRVELVQHLMTAGYAQDIADNTLEMLENLLDTLATLNSDALQQGEWCFVSFPAQLMANSVLTALSDPGSRLFASNFWNTQGISNDKKDQQRNVLNELENARFKNHASRKAEPIRYCYVAWSIIKLDNKILFYQREDTQKRFDKSAGDYGLIGGRANQNDIPLTDKAIALSALQSPHSELIKQSLPETLKRELREEAGLLFEQHYTFKSWRSLNPYQQVQGSAPNHALTEYYLDIFQIELTLEGYLYLQQKVEHDERLVWFSIEDMVSGETVDGKIPYIKALYDDFLNDRAKLNAELTHLPESFSSHYLFNPEKYGVTFPADCQKPILAGTLGKEKTLGLNVTPRQLLLLLGLVAHLRGFDFSIIEENITLHHFGWVEVANHTALQSELKALATVINSTDIKIENQRDVFFRLSVSPEVIFFDAVLYSFIVKK
ncbi:MAG: NUDIX hydrolase, partial [Methyloprofundus sp.]|nr:NUDIX hydrolase [Methyloprofundus sp.]